MSFPRLLVLLLALLMLAGCPAGTRAPNADSQFSDYAVAVRWNEFDKAIAFVDPQLRQAQALTDLERERYKLFQVTGYEVKDRQVQANGDILQVVEIRVVNRDTQIERVVTDRQAWRLDAAAKRYWLVSGLPDFSAR